LSFDPHKNFAYSTVATAPSPAASGTSLTLHTGDGALFPDPATSGAFNLTVWPTGVAPLVGNAEIVRCTARAGDVLTIARTQEGTSARTVVVGDQIALTITAKLLADIEAASTNPDPSVILVDVATGVAATDSAAIQAAIDACPSGGVVQLQTANGTPYRLGSTGLTIDHPLTLRGHGGADALWANFGTLITFDSATGVAIEQSCHGVKYENFALQNVHATAPTAGAGIRTVTGGGNSTHYGPNLSVRGFYYCVDHQAGGEWFMDHSVFLYDFVYCGLRMQNVDNVDSGDSWVSGQFVAGPTNNATACIQWLTGGGTKIIGAKCNTRGGKTCTVGVSMELQDGATTGDFQLIGCSIENSNWGFLLEHAGPSNTGVFDNLIIQGCEFLCIGGSGTHAIAVAAAVVSKVSQVNIGGNVIKSSSALQAGVRFVKIDNATHGPNVFKTNSGYSDGGSNTNITSVGAG
jgi:hypothetical protein